VTVTVDGADRLAATMHAAADAIRDLGPTNTKVAALIAGRTRPPRLTGRLAGSIRPSSDATTATVGTDVVYGPVHEYGWPRRNIRARRYLSGAFASSTDQAVAMYAAAISDAIGHVRGL